jgi:hypothetical protein
VEDVVEPILELELQAVRAVEVQLPIQTIAQEVGERALLIKVLLVVLELLATLVVVVVLPKREMLEVLSVEVTD